MPKILLESELTAYFRKIKALKYIGEPPVWENMHNHNEETDSTVSYTIYISIALADFVV